MPSESKDRIRSVISALNSIRVGELASISAKLTSAERDLEGLGQPDLEETVRAARSSLEQGDFKSFRRLVAQAVARLGHVK